jgi:hypothetical protein
MPPPDSPTLPPPAHPAHPAHPAPGSEPQKALQLQRGSSVGFAVAVDHYEYGGDVPASPALGKLASLPSGGGAVRFISRWCPCLRRAGLDHDTTGIQLAMVWLRLAARIGAMRPAECALTIC